MPIARKHAAASKGATGPRASESTSRFPNKPETIATRPLPRNIAFENVIDNHCCSKPLCRDKMNNYYHIKEMNETLRTQIFSTHIIPSGQNNYPLPCCVLQQARIQMPKTEETWQYLPKHVPTSKFYIEENVW